MATLTRDILEEQPAIPEQHLLTGAYRLYRPRYTYQPRVAGLPRVAIIDNGHAPTLAFVASLGRKNVELSVYGAHRWAITRWSRYCKVFDRCPSPDNYAAFVPWLRNKLRSGEITRVAPTSDLIIYYIALLRDEFPADVRRSIPRLAEVENCLIKSRFHALCKQHDLPAPETCMPDSVDEALADAARLDYPVVLKPKSHLVAGMAERGCVIHSPEELRRQFHAYDVVPGHEPLADMYPELRWPMIQKYIPSAQQVYSVSGIKDAYMGIAADMVSYKREQWPPEVGTSVAQTCCDDAAVLAAGLQVVESLLSRGIFEIELVADNNQWLAIDLNPRGFGFMALDAARGNDLAWLWLQSTLVPIARDEVAVTTPQLECRLRTPFYLSRLLGVLRGPQRGNKLRELWKELWRPSVAMIGSWRDPVPMLLARLSIFLHPRYLLRSSWKAVSRMQHHHSM